MGLLLPTNKVQLLLTECNSNGAQAFATDREKNAGFSSSKATSNAPGSMDAATAEQSVLSAALWTCTQEGHQLPNKGVKTGGKSLPVNTSISFGGAGKQRDVPFKVKKTKIPHTTGNGQTTSCMDERSIWN